MVLADIDVDLPQPDVVARITHKKFHRSLAIALPLKVRPDEQPQLGAIIQRVKV